MAVSAWERHRNGVVVDTSKVDRVTGVSQTKDVSAATSSQAQVVDPLSVTRRLQRDGRWADAETVRDRLIKECRQQGMSKPDAQAWSYSELNRLYPPLGAQWTDDSDDQLESVDRGNVTGLSDIPASWGQLPANATLQAEIAWCQANRLRVVEEKPHGATVVHLDLARTPDPSWSALGWLETSIRAYSKFVDVAAKVTATQQDEQEFVRRERMAIDEIRGLLAVMLQGSDERSPNEA